MNAEAHQEAIPACATTWKRTRYLMEGAQAIGRRGVVLSSESGLDASMWPDEALNGVLDGKEPSCAFCRHRDAYGETGRTTGAGEETHRDFHVSLFTELNRERWRWT